MISACPPPWAPLLENENLNEIQISGPGQIYVEWTIPAPGLQTREAGLGLQPLADAHLFLEPELLELQNFLSDAIEASPSLSAPFVEGNWRSFRVALVDACLTGNPHGFACLRRHRRDRPELQELNDGSGAFPPKALQMLKILLEDKSNALVVGPTSSGKTHLLQCLLNSLPTEERCLILEDLSELRCPNPVSGKLLSRPAGRGLLPAIPLQELVPMAMR
ncbi:MAG: ATPase, T2SS/T4P/T4SS family, partial [Bdellovibrio sp.]